MFEKTVIDADGLILGRMASKVAKRLLEGEKIEIVNSENAVVSGNRLQQIRKHKEFLNVGGHGKGPIHYRMPHMIVRKTIRGMLPYRKHKGRAALDRLRVYIGIPKALEKVEKSTVIEAHKKKLGHRFITIGEIAENIGWKKR